MSKLKELGLQDLYVDLNSEIMGTLYAKEGEVNSRGLRIFIMNNGQRFDSTGLDVSFYGRTKDNKVYQRVATEISTVNGMYEIIYPSNMLIAGDVIAELRLSKEDGSNIATKDFIISIGGRIITEDLIDGIDEPDLIDKLLQAAVNENDRVNNELVREENEGERINLYNEIRDKLNAGEFNGKDGKDGKDGEDGEDGESGLSAYEIWLDEGNTGTEQDFLDSLEGPQGPPGEGSGGGVDLGSHSSDEPIENYTNEHKAQVNVSENSSATASVGNSQVNASRNSTASGIISQVNASMASTASGQNSQVNASGFSTASEYYSQVNASDNSEASTYFSQVNASMSVINDTDLSSAWGYGDLEGGPSTQNIKIHLLSESGNINHSGVLNSGHNFTDYAELFPNLTGIAQGYGLIQTIDGHGVRPANSGDQVVGVTSATAGVVLGETPFSWTDRWLKDEWGAFIMEDVVDERWEPNEDQTEEDRPVYRLPKENPDYDPEREYVKRQERPDEWTVVGLVGQVYVRLDENVEPMDYVKPLKDGVGQTSDEPTKLRVMKITQAFDADKGYKIGFCLLS